MDELLDDFNRQMKELCAFLDVQLSKLKALAAASQCQHAFIDEYDEVVCYKCGLDASKLA